MKKIIVMVLLTLSLMSCTKKEVSKAKYSDSIPLEFNFMQSKTLQDLRNFDTLYLSAKTNTKLSNDGRRALVAVADVAGLVNGSSDGSSIGFWAGWFLGNPVAGKVIGGIIGGLMVGVAYSVVTSNILRNTANVSAEEMYNNTVMSLVLSGQLECLSVTEDNSIIINIKESMPRLPIVLPEEEDKEALFIGQTHNMAVDVMLNVNQEPIVETKSFTVSETKIDDNILKVLYSDELKHAFMDNYNYFLDISDNKSNDALINIEKSGIGGIIIKNYLQLHESYVETTSESIEITNGYIQIVNSSQELTQEEKQIITSALTLASYSTDLWTN